VVEARRLTDTPAHLPTARWSAHQRGQAPGKQVTGDCTGEHRLLFGCESAQQASLSTSRRGACARDGPTDAGSSTIGPIWILTDVHRHRPASLSSPRRLGFSEPTRRQHPLVRPIRYVLTSSGSVGAAAARPSSRSMVPARMQTPPPPPMTCGARTSSYASRAILLRLTAEDIDRNHRHVAVEPGLYLPRRAQQPQGIPAHFGHPAV